MTNTVRNRPAIRGVRNSVRRPARAAAALLLGATLLASGTALAQHHRGPRVGIGIHFGVPLYWPYYPAYAYPPYYYYPPVITVPAAPPPVYVERGDGQSDSPPVAQAPSSDWFYCAKSRMYYPYARECTGGWQRVPAQPVR